MKQAAIWIRVVVCFLVSLIPVRELEHDIYSRRMEFRPRPPSARDITILEIEAPEFSEFYWDSFVFKQVFTSLLPKEPAAVVMSWFIPREVIGPMDLDLAFLVRDHRVIWSSYFDSEAKFMRPPLRLGSPSRFGLVNVDSDADGEVRSGELAYQGQPTLAATIAQFMNPGKLRNIHFNRFLINYMDPAQGPPVCHLSELIQGAAGPCQELTGKIVILSRSVQRSGIQPSGLFRTPVGELTRAEILASEIHTILGDHRIFEVPRIVLALFNLGAILLTAYFILNFSILVSSFAVISSGLFLLVGLFQILFQFEVYIPTTNVILAFLASYLVFSGYKQARQENLQWRALKQSQYLRELDQMKSNFLSLMSHDLKTPLAKIQATVDRLKRDPKLTTDILDSIENSNNELKHYITGILNLSRIESQKVILNKKSNDINLIIEQVLKRFSPIAQAKGIVVETTLEPLFSVECDEDLIKQVLGNLLDNAIKYSPQASKISVHTSETEGEVRVDVKDSGPGIPKDQLPLMFRKFSRLARPAHAQVKGTGLGLYLSKYFIELHGGQIQVHTREDEGSTFSFTLPLQAG